MGVASTDNSMSYDSCSGRFYPVSKNARSAGLESSVTRGRHYASGVSGPWAAGREPFLDFSCIGIYAYAHTPRNIYNRSIYTEDISSTSSED